MRRVLIACVLLLAWLVQAEAATLTVGSGKTYATIQACANAATAGDTCLVDAGTYDEYVETAAGGTSEAQRITFLASGTVTLKGFRVKHPYVTVQGFTLTHYAPTASNLNAAAIRIEPAGDYAKILNNTITDGIYVHSEVFYFNATNRTVTAADVDFVAAGFITGIKVYIGTDSNAAILNGNNTDGETPPAREAKIATVTNSTTLTFPEGTYIADEGPVESTIWAVYLATDYVGMYGVLFYESGGLTADHCVVQGNTFHDLAGTAIKVQGNDNLITKNTFTAMNGWRMIEFLGDRNTISYNVFKDSPRWSGFSPCSGETCGGINWDMYDAMFVSWPSTIYLPAGSDNVIEYNFISGVDNEFTNIASFPNTGDSGLTIRRNVFYDYEQSGNITRLLTTISNNTFYNCATISAYTFVLGDSSATANHYASGSITNNAFVTCSSDASDTGQGWYSTNGIDGQPTEAVTADYNFVTGTSWATKTGFVTATLEAHGINGGDPQFVNAANPLGPDGLAFTLDDGLRPVLGSPLCDGGSGGGAIGAYDCYPATTRLVCATEATCGYQTVQACATAAQAGDTCLVSPGTYAENVNSVLDGSAGARITFRALTTGVVIEGFELTHAYHTIDGFEITGDADGEYAAVLIMHTADNTEVLNNNIHDISSSGGIWVYMTGTSCADGTTIRGNSLSYIATAFNNSGWVQTCGTGVLVETNTFSHLDAGYGQDFIRIWGDGVTVRRNTFIGGTATANHPDVFQTFSVAGVPAKNVLIEENLIYNLDGAIAFCQLEAGNGDGTVNTDMHSWTWRRNVVHSVYSNASAGHIPYSTFHHNTFYKLAYAASGISLGGSLWRGGSDHATFTNNVWLDVGSAGTTTTGWYPNGINAGALLDDETLNGMVTSSDQTATDAIQADLVTNGYTGGNGDPLSPAYTLYASYNSASPDASGMTFTVAEGYQGYKLDTYVALMETVEMDILIRSTYVATNNYVAGSVAGGYTAKRSDGGCASGVLTSERFCEVVLDLGGVNGSDPSFTNILLPLGADNVAFTVDDGLKPGVSSNLCAKASDGATAIGAYSCDPAKVWSGSVKPPSNVIVKEP